MDKNFINIDDLVRQRLGGGEENERAGAWLQMRDLLDKEMPQKRAGFIYWRRMFSAVAVLLLITSVSVGSYMFSRALSGNNAYANNNNNDLTPNVSSTSTNTTEVNNSKQILSTGLSHHTRTINNEHNNQQKNIKAIAAVKHTHKQIPASNQIVGNIVANNSNEHNNKNQKEDKNRKFISQLIVANERNKQQAHNVQPAAIASVKNNTTENAATILVTPHHSVKTKNTNNSNTTIGLANKSTHKNVTDNSNINVGKPLSVDNATLASNNRSAFKHAPGSKAGTNIYTSAPAKTSNKSNRVNINKLALSSNVPSAKNLAGVSTTNIAATIAASNSNNNNNNNNKLSSNNIKASASNSSATTNSTVNNINSADKKPADNNDSKQSASSKSMRPTQGANNNIITKEIAAVKMGKKVIERLVMTEHYVKTAPNEGYYKLDTISLEAVNEELGINNNNNNTNRNLPNTSRKGQANSAEDNNDIAQANTNTPILPGATTSAAGKSGMGLKENHTAKMGTGTSTAEKLSATFNDIKLHVSGAQFAPGLTAGVNGTFFGPSSFKGFQFGITGNFMFGENLSVLTELKYFHRINNNYSLNDNYYTYTPVAGGQYSKELNPVSYNFSTLHSFEMPISIRYCLSHFNFFIGGNLVYSFAINTGATTITTGQNTPVLVSAPGNDNAPKIKPDDFNSRFGLGYLFGISYQLSPNVMLDFRNVQTVWNNASSQGAKIISNQLYKSPSLQVSIGYRFGGKGKNKE